MPMPSIVEPTVSRISVSIVTLPLNFGSKMSLTLVSSRRSCPCGRSASTCRLPRHRVVARSGRSRASLTAGSIVLDDVGHRGLVELLDVAEPLHAAGHPVGHRPAGRGRPSCPRRTAGGPCRRTRSLSLISSTYLTFVPYFFWKSSSVGSLPHVDVERPVREVACLARSRPWGSTLRLLRRCCRCRPARREEAGQAEPERTAGRLRRSSVRRLSGLGRASHRSRARCPVVLAVAHFCPPRSLRPAVSQRSLSAWSVWSRWPVARRRRHDVHVLGRPRQPHPRAGAGQPLALCLVRVRDEHGQRDVARQA